MVLVVLWMERNRVRGTVITITTVVTYLINNILI